MIVTWSVNVDEQPHTVELEHSLFTGRRWIKVDDQYVVKTMNMINTGKSSHPFQIGSHRCRVLLNVKTFGASYDLTIDDVSQGTQEITLNDIMKPMPRWGWLFIALLALINVFGMIRWVQLSGTVINPRTLVIAMFYVIFTYVTWSILTQTKRSAGLRALFASVIVVLSAALVLAAGIGCACIFDPRV